MKKPSRKPARKGARSPRRLSRFARPLIAGLVVLAVLFALIEWVAPPLILKTVNRKLNKRPEYSNHVADLDINLVRGGYTLHDFKIRRRLGDTLVPIFTARSLDVSFQWSALFRGRMTGEVVAEKPVLNFVLPFIQNRLAKKKRRPWKRFFDPFFPFPIDRLVVREGEMHYLDFPEGERPVDAYLDDFNGEATGLFVVRQDARVGLTVDSSSKTASLRVRARAMGKAPVRVDMKTVPGARHPTFDLDARLGDLPLASLNGLFRSYAGVDVERGTFGFAVRLDAAQGRFQGNLRPRTRDLKIFSPEKDEGNLLQQAKEAIVHVVAKVVEKKSASEEGSDVPLSGSFTRPELDEWEMLGELLGGAFVRALDPRLGKPLSFGDGIRWDEPAKRP
jgi:hypothetical protein